MSRSDPISMMRLMLLLAQESRFEKHDKDFDTATINVAIHFQNFKDKTNFRGAQNFTTTTLSQC